MTEQVFASVWGLSYSDLEFLREYRSKSQVMIVPASLLSPARPFPAGLALSLLTP